MGLILIRRRQFPCTVLAVMAGLVTALVVLHASQEGGFIPVLIASYSATVYTARKVAIGLAVTAVGVLAVSPAELALTGHSMGGQHPPVTTIIAAAGASLVGWVVRRQLAMRAAQVKLVAKSAELAAEHQQDEARQARLGERLRIARELHDIIGHHISVVVIQAQGAQRIAASDPDRAVAAMAEVERTGRTALDEMRRLLGLLRSGEPATDDVDGPAEPDRGSLPGLDDIGALAERLRSAGLDVTVSTAGQPCDVPEDVGLAGYRIVQEALTNVLKHAGPARVRVGLDFTDGLDISVTDDGRGAAANLNAARVPGAGRGISGMSERAAAAGGELTAGPRPGGGFRVHARIPVS
jgi:signal transduction histidine kinase